jgi:GMP reductase
MGIGAADAAKFDRGMASTCTCVGARRLREFSKRTTFVRVSEQANEVFGRL